MSATLQIQENRTFRNLGLAGVYLGMAGLSTSPVALTVSTFLILIGAIGSVPLKEQWRRFWGNKVAFLLSLILLFQFASGLYTFNAGGWLAEMRIKLPLAVILFGMSILGPFTLKEKKISLGLLILSTFVTGTLTLFHYLANRVEIDALIASSKPMEIMFKIPHIYYSIVMAFSILGGYWFFRQKTIALHRYEKWIVGAATLANFAYLHVLTTRTGLVACYLAILGLGILIFLRNRQYLRLAILLGMLTALPVMGYFTVPSLKARLVNTYWDVWNWSRGGDPNYLSIATRLESWRVAYDLIERNPLLGVGTADLHDEMTLQYVLSKSLLCPENQVEPHNMFITYFAGYGILGGVYFIFCWFYPLFRREIRSEFLFQAFWLISTFAMMGEATLERQVGIMFMALCLMISMPGRENPGSAPVQD